MYRHTSALWFLVLALVAAVMAAGCGSSESETGSDKKTKAIALGLDEKYVCIVGGGDTAVKVASADVEEFADLIKDIVEESGGDDELDIDDMSVEDYDGDLEPHEILALDSFVVRAIRLHAFQKADLKLDDDAVDEELEDIAKQANIDVDELVERIDDDLGLDEDALRAGVESELRLGELYDDLSRSERREFDDEEDFGDELVEQYDDDGLVRCAKGVAWDEDLDPVLDNDGQEIDVEELLSGRIAAAVAGGSTTTTTTSTTAEPPTTGPDPVAEAQRYDSAVAPLLSSTGAVLLRFIRSSEKLTGGSISVPSLIKAYKEQAADMARVNRLAGKVTVQDGYLMKHHRSFRRGTSQVERAVKLMSTIDKLGSESALNARLKEVERAIDAADREFTAWHNAMGKDPKARSFTKIDREWSRLSTLFDQAT